MMKLPRAPRLGLAFVATVLLLGCGGSDGPARYAVSGKVTLEGQPLESGLIRFEPQGPPNIPGGAVIENGQYSVPAENGLPAGKYTVRISSAASGPASTAQAPGEVPPPAQERIPPEFNASTETVEVGPDQENVFDYTIP